MEMNFEENEYEEKDEKREFEVMRESFPLPLSKEEQNGLLIKMKDGDKEARKVLIERNLRLVASVAKKYIGNGIPLEDLIQEGSIGLMKALDAFDPERGCQLSTYAKPKVESEILLAVKTQTNSVHVPIATKTKIRSYNKRKQEEIQKSGRYLTLLELSERLNMDIEEIKSLEMAQKRVRSLYETYGENDTEMIDFIAIDTPSVEETIEKQELADIMIRLLENPIITDIQRMVIIYRMGLYGENRLKLRELAKILNVTEQRVSTIEQQALRNLAKIGRTKNLYAYMDNPESALASVKKKIYNM